MFYVSVTLLFGTADITSPVPVGVYIKNIGHGQVPQKLATQ